MASTTDVPLAAMEEEEDEPLQQQEGFQNPPSAALNKTRFSVLIENSTNNIDRVNNNFDYHHQLLSADDNTNQSVEKYHNQYSLTSPAADTFSEGEEEILGAADSLEDLVNSFDQKITQCFKDMAENTQNVAPVQMRTQDDIMNESQIWWTLTGNFGNILPIDWSKNYARSLQLPALHLQPRNDNEKHSINHDLDVSDDEELAQALDLHSLITSNVLCPEPPPQTADQVIEEIDEMMQQSYNSEWTACSELTTTTASSESFCCSPNKSPLVFSTMSITPGLDDRGRDAVSVASSEESLSSLTYKELASIQYELESLIQNYNEALVQELAVRGEMEYEKELKNCFISLLLDVQAKRRQWMADSAGNSTRKRASVKLLPTAFSNEKAPPQFVTAIIPYDEFAGPPDNNTLERLVKILQAVNSNSSAVPNMLTDYILNVICPSARPLSQAW